MSKKRESVERAVEASARAVRAAERGIDETASPFVAWATRHEVDVESTRDARIVLRMGGIEDVKHGVNVGYRYGKNPEWTRSGTRRHNLTSVSAAYRAYAATC